MNKVQEIVKAIREDELLGKGSCSSVDECYTDEELAAEVERQLKDESYHDAKSAIKFLVWLESVFWERQGMFDTVWHKANKAYKGGA